MTEPKRKGTRRRAPREPARNVEEEELRTSMGYALEAGQSRMKHGDVRAALLLTLEEGGPGHGYELGQRLLRASGGAWQPSPGSIYPTLQALADEGLVTSLDRDGKRIYTLTAAGRAVLDERAERKAPPPWQAALDGRFGELRDALVGLKMAAKQAAAVGSPAQCERVVALLVEAKRRIYDVLARG